MQIIYLRISILAKWSEVFYSDGSIDHIRRVVLTTVLVVCFFSCSSKTEDEDLYRMTSVMGPTELTKAAEEKQSIGAFAEAIDELHKALKINTNFIPAHYRMGSIYDEWGRKDEAVRAYRATLKLDPDHVEARLGLASVYSKMVKNSLAVEELKKVAQLRPKDEGIYFKIALEYWYLQKLPETVENYRRVIDMQPDHLQAHLNLASVYEKMKDWPGALEEIEIALRLARRNNDEHSISIAKGKLDFIKGRMDMTAKDLERKSQPPFD